ncbi:hypothetical protein JCM8097_007915 [Rhodosporidiobolus ruineniae]
MPGPSGQSGPLAIPVVSFRPLDPSEPFATPPRLDNNSFTAYGYNDGKGWDGYRAHTDEGEGMRYRRWHPPMETELARQVEYDMDDQDQLWLDAINADRKKDGQPQIPYEVFEIIMDKIEKEWFDLTKNIPKKSNAVPTEDSKCAICDDGECENSNAIVFCDGCNLAVHQDCYGVPYIPEGQWLCRKCTVSPEKPVTCVLCPNPYGAFKQTTTGQWAHLLCAIWIPDTGVSNTVYMEPVDGVDTIQKSRWKLVCYLCKKRVGACIQCAKSSCYTAFHVSCAREYGLELKMKQQGNPVAGDLKAYCDKHGARPAPATLVRALTQAKARGGSAASYLKLSKKKTFKTARGYKGSSSLAGPPVVPAVIAEKVVQYVQKVKMAGKKAVVDLVCRYWSLKREARRGAPLLKRIHLEPWTASATSHSQSDADKATKLALLRALRNDLEKVRMLTEQVRKREKKKLERAVLLRQVVERFVWPKEGRLAEVLEKIKGLDKNAYFLHPVDLSAVPDYSSVIKHPMDLSTITSKLASHAYSSPTGAGDFVGDVRLVLNNARRYNKPYSNVHKAAVRVIDALEEDGCLDELEKMDERGSEENVLAFEGGLAALLDEEAVGALWEQGYDVEDPDGSRAKKREEDARRRKEEEAEAAAAKEREEKAAEEKREREEKAAKVAAAKAKAGAAAAMKGKGKGKGKPEPTEEEDEDEAMDVDAADVDEPARPAAAKGKKRTAAVAGLDDAPTPARASRSRAAGGADKEKEEKKPAVKPAGSAKKKAPAPAPKAPSPSPVPASPALGGKKIPAALEDVREKDFFTHFETGWVLPEGSSRRRSSALPTLSTSISTPKPKPKPAAPATASTSKVPAAPSASSKKRPRVSVSASVEPEAKRAAASGKKGKGKAVEPVSEAEAEDDDPEEDDEEVVVASPPVAKSAKKDDKAKEKEKEKASPTKRAGGGGDVESMRQWEERFRELTPKVAITDETELEDGYLVWARMPGYAWYPAEIVDPDDEDTPEICRKAKPAKADDKVPVLFFGKQRTAAWLTRSFLRELGESAEFDQLLLEPLHIKSVYSNNKRPAPPALQQSKIAEVREAFEEAKERMESSEDERERLAAEGASPAKGKGGSK